MDAAVEAGWQAQQVVLRVARCSDRADAQGIVSQFAEDGVMEAGDHRAVGREALLQFFGGGGAPSESPTERTKHVVTNTVVSADADELLATSYFQVLRSWGVANWGRYEDRLANRLGSWQIVHRKVFVDGQVPRPERPAGATTAQ